MDHQFFRSGNPNHIICQTHGKDHGHASQKNSVLFEGFVVRRITEGQPEESVRQDDKIDQDAANGWNAPVVDFSGIFRVINQALQLCNLNEVGHAKNGDEKSRNCD